MTDQEGKSAGLRAQQGKKAVLVTRGHPKTARAESGRWTAEYWADAGYDWPYWPCSAVFGQACSVADHSNKTGQARGPGPGLAGPGASAAPSPSRLVSLRGSTGDRRRPSYSPPSSHGQRPRQREASAKPARSRQADTTNQQETSMALARQAALELKGSPVVAGSSPSARRCRTRTC